MPLEWPLARHRKAHQPSQLLLAHPNALMKPLFDSNPILKRHAVKRREHPVQFGNLRASLVLALCQRVARSEELFAFPLHERLRAGLQPSGFESPFDVLLDRLNPAGLLEDCQGESPEQVGPFFHSINLAMSIHQLLDCLLYY